MELVNTVIVDARYQEVLAGVGSSP